MQEFAVRLHPLQTARSAVVCVMMVVYWRILCFSHQLSKAQEQGDGNSIISVFTGTVKWVLQAFSSISSDCWAT